MFDQQKNPKQLKDFVDLNYRNFYRLLLNTVVVNFVPLGISENEITPVKISNSKDEIVISDIYPITNLNIFDLTGRIVYKIENGNQKEVRFNKGLFSKGIYVINIESSHRLSKHKIIIE